MQIPTTNRTFDDILIFTHHLREEAENMTGIVRVNDQNNLYWSLGRTLLVYTLLDGIYNLGVSTSEMSESGDFIHTTKFYIWDNLGEAIGHQTLVHSKKTDRSKDTILSYAKPGEHFFDEVCAYLNTAVEIN